MIDGRYGKEVDVLSYSMDKCMYFYRRLIRVGDQYGGVELECSRYVEYIQTTVLNT